MVRMREDGVQTAERHGGLCACVVVHHCGLFSSQRWQEGRFIGVGVGAALLGCSSWRQQLAGDEKGGGAGSARGRKGGRGCCCLLRRGGRAQLLLSFIGGGSAWREVLLGARAHVAGRRREATVHAAPQAGTPRQQRCAFKPCVLLRPVEGERKKEGGGGCCCCFIVLLPLC